MAIKMIDVGTMEDVFGPGNSRKKEKRFPTLSIDKKIGDLDIGDDVVLIAKARVRSMREDEDGFSMSFKIKSIGVKRKNSLGQRLADEVLT